MTYVILLVAAVVGYIWFMRSRELFRISVRDGKQLLVRGRAPGGLMTAFSDVVSNPPVVRGTIIAYRTPGGASIDVSGDIDEWREQRLRNIFNLYPASQLRAAPIGDNRTFGQVLGIAWLAWLLEDRR